MADLPKIENKDELERFIPDASTEEQRSRAKLHAHKLGLQNLIPGHWDHRSKSDPDTPGDFD